MTGERLHERVESVNLHSYRVIFTCHGWLQSSYLIQTTESQYVIGYPYVALCPDMCCLARCPCVSVSCVKKISRKPQRQSGVWRKHSILGIFHESWRRKVKIDPFLSKWLGSSKTRPAQSLLIVLGREAR